MGVVGFEEDGKLVPFSNGYATVDWTKQLALRKTIWKWVSLSGVGRLQAKDGSKSEASVGINFSTGMRVLLLDKNALLNESTAYSRHHIISHLYRLRRF